MPLSNTGFVADSVDEIVQDLNGKFLANVDPGIDLSPDQPFGQIIGVFSEKFAEIEELEATVYNAINPAAAEGALLVNVAALSGTRPQVATYSLVGATLTLNASTTVTAGSVAYVAGQPANRWVLVNDVTSTTAGGYTGGFRSETPGIFRANAGTLTVIATPTIGWTAVTNPADSIDGLAADTDTSLRLKREEELAGQGSGDIDALRAAALKVPGVITAFAFENTSLTTDSTGLPGKAFRVVVWDGPTPLAADTAIAQAIWNTKPSGIQSFGAVSATATDSQGNPQTVYFDRATQLRTYVSCTTTPATLTTDQTASVKAAIKGYADTVFGLGVGIIARSFSASPLEPVTPADATAIRPAYTPPVTDVPVFQFDTHATPTNTANKSATTLQIYTVAMGDILVNGI
jgi:uncharacterized phage protein gp47/JayE